MNGGSAERVDVVIPVKYGLEYLPQALVSVAAQGVAIDVVVVDDGSPTSLQDVCSKFGSKVRCLRQENAGPATARNTGARSTSAPPRTSGRWLPALGLEARWTP